MLQFLDGSPLEHLPSATEIRDRISIIAKERLLLKRLLEIAKDREQATVTTAMANAGFPTAGGR